MKKISLALFSLFLPFLFLASNVFASEISSPEFPGGSLKVSTDQTQEFPLKHTSVSADIKGYVSEVEVRQEYINPYQQPIEAVYIFPLPHNAAVYDMEMRVGQKVVKADIKRRAEAQKAYEEAKQQGKRAGLLEQERSNIFTQSVANILPGDDITIVIRYTETLTFDKNKYQFVFPTVVGPRYIPGEWIEQNFVPRVTDWQRINPPVLPPGMRSGHDIDITVSLDTGGMPITNLSSVTHQVDIAKNGDSKAQIKIKPTDTIPNKDFVLDYELSSNKPQFAFFTYKPQNEDGYFSLMIQPQTQFTTSEVTPKEIFFIVDTSGSMMGEPIEKSKEAMSYALKHLNPEDSFYLMKFSNVTLRLSNKPLLNTPENVLSGLQYIDSIKAGGGTEMLPGILEALEYPHDPKKLRIVVMMGDGYIGNKTEILDAIQSKLGDQTRLFSFGIGSSVNRYLLDNMGKIGRGSAYYVTLRDVSEDVVDKFYQRISSPLLTDLKIDWGGMQVTQMYPSLTPDLFAGQPLYVHGRYSQSGNSTIKVTGRVASVEEGLGNNLRKLFGIGAAVDRNEELFSIPAVFPEVNQENSWIGRIWARNKITDLTDQMFKGEQPALVEEVTTLGLRHRLVTKYTSFVAVEEIVATSSGTPQRVEIPVELPEGTVYEGFFGSPSGGYSGGGISNLGLPSFGAPSGAIGLSSSYGYGYSALSSSPMLLLIFAGVVTVVSIVVALIIAFFYWLIRRKAENRKSFKKVFFTTFFATFVLLIIGVRIFLQFVGAGELVDGLNSYISSYGAVVAVALLLLLGLLRRVSWRKILVLSVVGMVAYYAFKTYSLGHALILAPDLFLRAGLISQVVIFVPVLTLVAYIASLWAIKKERRWGYIFILALAIFALIGVLLSGVWPITSLGWSLLSVVILVSLFSLKEKFQAKLNNQTL